MKEIKELKIAVLAGGIGQEREVSLQSGKCVYQAMKDGGLNVIMSDISPDNLAILDDKSIDVFFLALHGSFGEDGQLQQIMENRHLCYTGSGPAASRKSFDKVESKKAFIKAGVKTADYIELKKGFDKLQLEKQLKALSNKYVIKPLRQGSSVGISIVENIEQAVEISQKCLSDFGDCMIEKFIDGQELTVGILCNNALPIIEIRAKKGFYDYHAKYIDDATEYLFDTIADKKVVLEIQKAAVKCFESLGCRHFSRVDFILTKDDAAYALEINTIPGFTTHSLLPKAAAKTGLSMDKLCIKIIETARVNIK